MGIAGVSFSESVTSDCACDACVLQKITIPQIQFFALAIKEGSKSVCLWVPQDITIPQFHFFASAMKSGREEQAALEDTDANAAVAGFSRDLRARREHTLYYSGSSKPGHRWSDRQMDRQTDSFSRDLRARREHTLYYSGSSEPGHRWSRQTDGWDGQINRHQHMLYYSGSSKPGHRWSDRQTDGQTHHAVSCSQ
jgi:hypothetical protein